MQPRLRSRRDAAAGTLAMMFSLSADCCSIQIRLDLKERRKI